VQNPVVWNSGGTITDLAPTAGDAGFVNDLNEIAACGYATSAAYPAGVAHRWVLGGAAGILGTLAPGKRSDARAINASDVVVGTAQDGSNVSRAFRWRASDGMKDLNTLYASGTQYFLLNASAISDGGQIVGSTYTTQPASVLLTPSGCFATLRPIGAEIGGTVSFRYSSPCHPGLVGVTFVSLTGAALTLPLPGGVSIKLTPDAFMYKFFALTFLSMVTLDGTGVGTTAGLPIPNNPLIVGLPMWAAGAIYDLAQSKFVAATSTNAWVLLP
jgi:probable HAF family extracellular repeat protein